MWKILIAQEKGTDLQLTNKLRIIPEERKRSRRTAELLYIDQHIRYGSKTRRKI